jgi:hypothetical protein
MAFSCTKDQEGVAGDLRVTSGTFTASGSETGGSIYTGLQKIDGIMLQQNASAVVASQPVVNGTFPTTDPVTIVTAAGADGYWWAFGH